MNDNTASGSGAAPPPGAAATAGAPAPAAPARPSTTAGSRAVVALALMAAMALLYEFKYIFLPLFLALYLTFTLAPLVRWLRRYRIHEALGAAIVVIGLLVAAGLLVVSVAGPANAWLQRAPSDVQQLHQSWQRLRASIPMLAPPPQEAAPAKKTAASRNQPPPPPPPDPIADKIASESMTLGRAAVVNFGMFAIQTAATIMLLYFLLASERWLLTATVAALPQRRPRVALVGGVRAAQREIGTYLASQSMVNVGLGVATGVAMHFVGLPNPTLWGALAGILNFIPYLGPALLSAILLLAGVLTFDSFGQMMAPAAAFLAINAIESNVITPWFVGKQLRISALAVFVSVLFWGGLWGIGGALIAVPTLIAFRSACRRRRSLRLWCAYLDPPNDSVPSIRRLLARAGTRRRVGRPSRPPPSSAVARPMPAAPANASAQTASGSAVGQPMPAVSVPVAAGTTLADHTG